MVLSKHPAELGIVSLQFIESSVLALRAAHYRLAHPSRPTEFLLFPMVHIGSADYYRQVRSRLEPCDVVLFEGVRSFRGTLLTLSYRLVARRSDLGLVTQAEALQVKSLGARKVHADLNPAAFGSYWTRVPWHVRVALLVCAPLYGMYLYLTASRASIARRLNTEDLESSADILRDEDQPGLNEVMHHRRNAKLIAAIEAELNGPGQKIAIVYGGAHMRAATRLLMNKHGYRVVHSEWLTVFDRAG